MYDIVTIGGGVSGSTATMLLAQIGAKICVIDQKPETPSLWPDTPGERLPAVSKLLFDQLSIPYESFCRASNVTFSIWSGGFAEIGAAQNIDDQRKQTHGAIVITRKQLDVSLMEKAIHHGAEYRLDTRLHEVSKQGEYWEIKVYRNGKRHTIKSRFIIDASGRKSVAVRKFGVKSWTADNLIALMVWVKDHHPKNTDFIIEAQKHGWWYSTGLPDGRRIIAYLTFRPTRKTKPQTMWQQALAQAPRMQYLCEQSECIPRVFTATPGRLSQVYGSGWAAIGDAAIHTDPIEGRGVLRGMESALMLFEILSAPQIEQASIREKIESLITANFQKHLTQRYLAYHDSDRISQIFKKQLYRPHGISLSELNTST